jgi:hypothetical protein
MIAALVSACGSGSEQNPGERHTSYHVQVSSSFPTAQKLAQESLFVVSVKNTSGRTIPDVAVTVTNPKFGDTAQSFGYLLPVGGQGQPIIANRSRPIWIVTQAPGPCRYSCRKGGPGAAASAYTDTWSLGRLAPGRTARFAWKLTATEAGTFEVEYQIAAGLNGYAKAVDRSGRAVVGRYRVTISGRPQSTYVKSNGQVVYSP